MSKDSFDETDVCALAAIATNVMKLKMSFFMKKYFSIIKNLRSNDAAFK
jgi:hypothetical protein